MSVCICWYKLCIPIICLLNFFGSGTYISFQGSQRVNMKTVMNDWHNNAAV
jgi:hypothetical protein